MYMLDKLWRGQISPSERFLRSGTEYKKLSKELCDALDRFSEMLPKEAKSQLDQIDRLQLSMLSISEEDAFIVGFRMGARTILDIINDYRGPFTSPEEEP